MMYIMANLEGQFDDLKKVEVIGDTTANLEASFGESSAEVKKRIENVLLNASFDKKMDELDELSVKKQPSHEEMIDLAMDLNLI